MASKDEIKIGVDTSDATAKLNNLADTVKKTGERMTKEGRALKLADGLDKASASAEKLNSQISKVLENLSKMKAAGLDASNAFDGLKVSGPRGGRQTPFVGPPKPASSYVQNPGTFVGPLPGATAANNGAGAAAAAFARQAAAAQRAAAANARVASSNANVASSAGRAASATTNMVGSLGRLAAAAGGIALLVDQFGKLVKVATKSEQIFQTLKFSTGSEEKAAEQLQFVTEQANRLGQSLPVVASEFGKLSAAAKGTDFGQDDVQQLFLGLTEYATVLKVPVEDVQGSMTALVQMISKGKVSSEELRQQLGDRLPGAFALAAKASGKTTAEFQKLLDTGQVDSASFLRLFAKELRGAAENDLPAATDSVQANLNRLETAVFQFRANIVKGGAGEAIKEATKDLTAALENPQLAQFAGVLGAALLKVQTIAAKVFASMGEAAFQFGYGAALTWSKVREFFGDMASGIQRTWNKLMSNLKLRLADLVDGFANGLGKIPLIGDDLAGKAKAGAAYLRASAQVNQAIVSVLDSNDKTRRAYEKDFREGVKDARNAAALATLQAPVGDVKTPGINKNPGPLKLLGGDGAAKAAKDLADKLRNAQLALDEALAEQRKKLAEITAAQEQRRLEMALAKRELTERQFLEKTTAAKLEALDTEFKAQEDLIAKLAAARAQPAVDPAEAAKLDAELAKATTKLAEIADQKMVVEFDADKGLEDLRQSTADFKLQLQAEITDAAGRPLDAQLDLIADKFKKLREQYADDAGALALIGQREGQEVGAARRGEADRQLGFADQRLGLREAELQDQLNDGLLTTIEYNERLGKVRAESAAAMEGELAKLRDLLVANPGDVGLSLAIDELAAKIANLKKPVDDFASQFNKAMGSTVESTLKSARSFEDLFTGMLEGVLTYLRDYFAREAGQIFTKILQSSGSASGGGGFSFASLLKLLPGFATGGYTGPGAKYDIAGLTHADEFVFDKASVSAFGLPLLNFMWRNKRLPPGYATVGPVGASTSGSLGSGASMAPNVSTNVSANLFLDPEEAAAATFNTKTGEARILEVFMKNKRKLGIA